MRDERVELDERARVEQQLESFARGQLAARVLLLDALLATAELRLGAHRHQPLEPLLVRRHGISSRRCSTAVVSPAADDRRIGRGRLAPF